MTETRASAISFEQVRAVFKDWDAFPAWPDPDFARIYAGEWVVLFRGEVVVHGRDGSTVAVDGNVDKYPGAAVFYVPTTNEQNGVWVLCDSGVRI